ncbi:alpha/beta fold hydrolase [Cohnella kolymensis]|uniref:alpha/beta fold hydrolase n=1 Tax=Cohnella kolymensis TaxID=1590652 RepID=UPI0013793A45|nr:alpha/beta hydrolase [Cohnella kolymensis]
MFFHALSLDLVSMRNVMEPLFTERIGWRRIYVDLPGMGGSPAEDWMRSSDDVLSVIIEFLEKLIPGQRFVLAGLSYGGYIARGVAFKQINRVDGMLLISPMIKARPADRQLPARVVVDKDEALLASLQNNEPTGFENFAVVQTEEIWEKYKRDVLSGAEKSDRTFLTSEFRTKGYAYTFESVLSDVSFQKPALIVLGRQDAVSGYEDAMRLIESYPRATFTIMDRAGHFPQLEQETLLLALTDEWLERVETEAGVARQDNGAAE